MRPIRISIVGNTTSTIAASHYSPSCLSHASFHLSPPLTSIAFASPPLHHIPWGECGEWFFYCVLFKPIYYFRSHCREGLFWQLLCVLLSMINKLELVLLYRDIHHANLHGFIINLDTKSYQDLI